MKSSMRTWRNRTRNVVNGSKCSITRSLARTSRSRRICCATSKLLFAVINHQHSVHHRGPEMKSYDVVIVGAGLAGLQVSRRLAEQGFRVLLIDRKTSLSQSVHTTGIFVRRTLEDFPFPAD